MFTTDNDLQQLLPALFNYSITEYSQYHEPAGLEVVRDIKRLWIDRQEAVSRAQFDENLLDEDQLKRAACLRLIAWHALPRLSTEETNVEGFSSMIDIYQKLYVQELNAVLADGIIYDGEAVMMNSISETQRNLR